MTTKTKAARHSCNYNRAISQKLAALGRSANIITDYERGTFVAGLIVAVLFGLMFIHAAVM